VTKKSIVRGFLKPPSPFSPVRRGRSSSGCWTAGGAVRTFPPLPSRTMVVALMPGSGLYPRPRGPVVPVCSNHLDPSPLMLDPSNPARRRKDPSKEPQLAGNHGAPVCWPGLAPFGRGPSASLGVNPFSIQKAEWGSLDSPAFFLLVWAEPGLVIGWTWISPPVP